MKRASPQDNPFDLTKASDFSDNEIAEQWVDLANATGGLVSILKPTLRMPMLLLGGKGSGKTHLMRYCSAPVQAARRGGDIARAIKEDGYLGVYIRADALNTDKFGGGGLPSEYWSRVFSMYFELWVATATLSIITDCLTPLSAVGKEKIFVKGVTDLFDVDIGAFETIAELREYLVKLRKSVDYCVNNSLLRGERPDVAVNFSVGRLMYGIPEVLSEVYEEFSGVLIVYLIDEVENLTLDQQKFLNSLIRYRRGNATIKLGARLYGIRTYETLGAGEPIKRDAEYERVELDTLLREQRQEYERYVNRLVAKRLKAFNLIANDEEDVSTYFEGIDSREYYRAIMADLEPERNGERPFHKRLVRDLIEKSKFSPEVAAEISGRLSVPEHLFLDKAAVFYYRKQWPRSVSQATELAMDISEQAKRLSSGTRSGNDGLRQVLSHFGSDILAQLYYDYRKRVPYAGFATLVDLSQGTVRNLLTNLKHIYRRSLFAGENPFIDGAISIKSQSEGVRDGAAWFWEDAQPSSGGLQVREAIESLALLYRTVRFSHSPSECDLSTFNASLDALSPNSKRTLEVAENWSYLIRLADGRKNKNNKKLDGKYQIAPMLAPRWEISEHRRGSIELQPEIANAIFDPNCRAQLPGLLQQRLENMTSPAKSPMGDLFS